MVEVQIILRGWFSVEVRTNIHPRTIQVWCTQWEFRNGRPVRGVRTESFSRGDVTRAADCFYFGRQNLEDGVGFFEIVISTEIAQELQKWDGRSSDVFAAADGIL